MSWHALLAIVVVVGVAVWSSFSEPALAAPSYPVSTIDSAGTTSLLAALGGNEDNDNDEDDDEDNGDEDNGDEDNDEDNGDEDNDEDNGDEDNDEDNEEAPAIVAAPTATLRPAIAAAPAQPTATPVPPTATTPPPTATRVPSTSTPVPAAITAPRPPASPVPVPVQVPTQLPRTGLVDLATTLLPAAGLGGLALASAGIYLRRRRR